MPRAHQEQLQAFAVFAFVSIIAPSASAQSQAGYEAFIRQCAAVGTHYPGPGYGTCVPRSDSGRPGGSGGTTGPSPEQQRQQREAQDLREAADDAQDRGIAAYERADYATAERLFTEAADYAPDDDDIAQNLRRTRERLQASEAARELNSAQRHGADAASSLTNEDSREHGSRVFDRTGLATNRANSAPVPPVQAGPPADPVVSVARRTPAITELERQRSERRARIVAIEAELETLSPSMHAMRIVRRRQQQDEEQSQVNMLNFGIEEALRAPPPAATPPAATPR